MSKKIDFEALLKDITSDAFKSYLKLLPYSDLKKNFEEAQKRHLLKIVENNPNASILDRFRDIVNPEMLEHSKIIVVGVGGIGAPVVRMLASVGFKNVVFFDDDIIEVHNCGPQGYALADMGMEKGVALQNEIFRTYGVEYIYEKQRVTAEHLVKVIFPYADILIMAVDSMGIRNEALELFKEHRPSIIHIDARMSLGKWNCYIFNSPNFQLIEPHAFSMMHFKDEEGIQEPCTARAISYTGYSVAMYIVSFLIWYGGQNNKLNETFHSFAPLTPEIPFSWYREFNSLVFNNNHAIDHSVEATKYRVDVALDFLKIIGLAKIISVLKFQSKTTPLPIAYNNYCTAPTNKCLRFINETLMSGVTADKEIKGYLTGLLQRYLIDEISDKRLYTVIPKEAEKLAIFDIPVEGDILLNVYNTFVANVELLVGKVMNRAEQLAIPEITCIKGMLY